jgi:hypothetical protein
LKARPSITVFENNPATHSQLSAAYLWVATLFSKAVIDGPGFETIKIYFLTLNLFSNINFYVKMSA